MADGIITNNDLGNVELKGGKFRDELLTFAGLDTFVAGTILARRAVALATTEAMDGGNTGDGTLTLATVVAGPVVPLVGTYVLTNIEAVVNGGVWKLEDPNGAEVATQLIQTVGAGAATVFEAAGLQFTVTDAATDFIVGDFGTIIVAADGKLVPYAIAGAGGEQNPMAVLTYDVTRASAGDEPIRALVAGEVNKTRLIIDLDGDGSNITDAILDALRSAGPVATDVTQLAQLDNQ